MSEDAGINDEIISKAAYGGEFLKLEQASSFAAPLGSASGGPEVWNVVAWGDVRECRDIATIVEEVTEALELGCRTISIERQGAPTASPNEKADRSQP